MGNVSVKYCHSIKYNTLNCADVDKHCNVIYLLKIYLILLTEKDEFVICCCCHFRYHF